MNQENEEITKKDSKQIYQGKHMPGKLLSVVLFLRLNKSFLILLKHTFPLKHLNLENFKEDCTVIWPVSPLDTKIWKNILSSWELILNSSKYHQHGIRSEIGISLITLNVFKCLTVSLFPLKFIFFGNGRIFVYFRWYPLWIC